MYSNFKDAFIKKPQFTVKTPDAVLAAISKDLPEGFRYVDDHDGFCRIDCGGKMDLTNSSIVIPEEDKILFEGKNRIPFQEILSYAYNTQTIVDILPDKDGYYIVNGEKIKCSDFVVSPLKGVKFSEGKLCISPPPFPDPFPIKIEGNGYSLNLLIQRKPFSSLTKAKYESVDDSAIKLSYIADTFKDGNMQFSISTQPSNSAASILAAKEIFNAFVSGNGILNGEKLPSSIADKSKLISEEILRFWRKVVDVESVLDIEFNMNQNVVLNDVETIYALHRSLVENVPFKIPCDAFELKGEGAFEDLDSRKDFSSDDLVFEFTEALSVILLGQNINLFALTCFFDCAINQIEVPESGERGDFHLKLVPVNGKKMYMSKMFFIDEQDMKKAKDDSTHIDFFRSAEELEKF